MLIFLKKSPIIFVHLALWGCKNVLERAFGPRQTGHPLHINDFPSLWGAGGLTKELRPLVSLCGRRVPYERRFITKSSRRPQKIGFPVMFAFAVRSLEQRAAATLSRTKEKLLERE